ncbi:hypothetical protein EGM88_10385 [Aureibaculum marinum]|uniref:DUF4412 domain-containing protein n=1 Tax=Aureibaculum marinum TaxID=2487930 RepID=A0A3N4NQE5_9FLAO|nr:DUF4412 domain-containing protein [Aureibaculum marinum]RPD96757.1 hypothetical protein EGM88_10385 [Aureibaculum marinum]
MKKLTLLLIATMSLSVFAQKEVKEGVISMTMKMSSENEQVNASLAMMGDLSSTTYFKGQKSRSEQKVPMAGETISIIDNDAKVMLILMDNPMMGKKYLKNDIEVSEDDLKNLTISETGDTKTVLDYECKGYNIVMKKDGQEMKMTMYTTDKIVAPTQNSTMMGDKLKGFPMYTVMNMTQQGMPMTITMEVTEIKAENVDNSKFDLTPPEGYTETEMPKQ